MENQSNYGGIIDSAYVYTEAGKTPIQNIHKGSKVLTDQRRFDVVDEVLWLSGNSFVVSDKNYSVIVHDNTQLFVGNPFVDNKQMQASYISCLRRQELLKKCGDKPIVSETGYMAHEGFPIENISDGRAGCRFINLALRGGNGFVADGVVIGSLKR